MERFKNWLRGIFFRKKNPVTYTLIASKGIPCVDGDWEIYVRREIALALGEQLLESGLIMWTVMPGWNDLDPASVVMGEITVIKGEKEL